MGNCLKTQLKDTVQNSNLVKLGEMLFKVTGSGTFYINPTAGQTLTVYTSDGLNHLGENQSSIELTRKSNIWSNGVDFESGNYNIIVSNKYSVSEIYCDTESLSFDADQLYYTDPIKDITLGSNCTLSKLNMTTTKKLVCYNIDISVINNNPIKYLDLKTSFGVPNEVNINVVSDTDTKLIFRNCDFAGGINNIISSASPFIHFNFTTELKNHFVGDLSLGGQNLKVFNLSPHIGNQEFIWSSERNNSFPAISMVNVELGDYVDAMLKNQARCVLNTPYSDSFKVIDVFGNHDSSDTAATAAIETIKAAGWSVKINNISY